MIDDRKALFAAIGMVLCFAVMLGMYVWKGFQVFEETNKADAAESQLERCRAGSVPINEYRQIVRSYDDLNADLRECVEYMDENAYLIDQLAKYDIVTSDKTEEVFKSKKDNGILLDTPKAAEKP